MGMENCICCGNDNSSNEEDIEKKQEINFKKELKDIKNVQKTQNKKKIFLVL